MMKFYLLSEKYDHLDVEKAMPPVLPINTQQHVFVTHDESTFYSNDYQKYAWV
jgi:hypothetical protein